MSRSIIAVLSVLSVVFLGLATVAPASAATPIPPRPNRDQVNIDARDFQVAPGVFAFKSPSGNLYCKIDTNSNGLSGCQAMVSVRPAGGPTCQNSGSNAYIVWFANGKVVHQCTSQGIFTASRQLVLPYGRIIMVQGTSCTSTIYGMACYQNRGFMISREVNLTI